jgi:hypothetical protein
MTYYLFCHMHEEQPELPTAESLKPRVGMISTQYPTEEEAFQGACRMIEKGMIVAAIRRPDKSLVTPREIRDRCKPPGKLKKVFRKLKGA